MVFGLPGILLCKVFLGVLGSERMTVNGFWERIERILSVPLGRAVSQNPRQTGLRSLVAWHISIGFATALELEKGRRNVEILR